MGQQADTSLTTGSRDARGKKRPRLKNDPDPSKSTMFQNFGTPVRKQQLQQSQQARQQRQQARQGRKGKTPGAPAPASPTAPAAPTGSTSPGPPSGTGGTPPDLASQLQPYTAPLPPLVKAYMDKLSGGQINAPDWQTMLNQYSTIANREADRQVAAIGESMGGYGGRYSSATLGQQATTRQQTADDLALAASTYQSDAEKQQFSEVMGVGGLAYASGEAGMDRYWQDFLRQTSPPPFTGTAADLATSYGLPATVFQ